MQIEEWISKEDIKELYSSEYWNNEVEEQKKAWFLDSALDQKLKKHLNESGLKKEFNTAINRVGPKLHGDVIDLAAGTCWVSALISKNKDVNHIDAVEMSKHRLEKLAPITIENLEGKSEKINLILGSFYEIKREKNSYDVVVLSQAFHHAEFPLKLFHECDRVLRPGGTIIIIGEHLITWKQIIKTFIKSLMKGKLMTSIFDKFYNHNDPLGDHSYRLNDYKFIFFSYGYTFDVLKSNLANSYILIGYKNNE